MVACHDPEVFPEPHQFRPDRWLSRTKPTQASSSQPTPMGGGSTTPTGIGSFTSTEGSAKSTGSATGVGLATPTGGGSTTPTEEKRIHPYTIVPFGHGARMCPGRRVAEQEIYLALIQVSRRAGVYSFLFLFICVCVCSCVRFFVCIYVCIYVLTYACRYICKNKNTFTVTWTQRYSVTE